MDNTGAKLLANAIVFQAFEDYKHCAKIHKNYPEGSEIKKQAEAEMASIMEFAKGDWFLALTDIPQSKFIAKLKELEQ